MRWGIGLTKIYRGGVKLKKIYGGIDNMKELKKILFGILVGILVLTTVSISGYAANKEDGTQKNPYDMRAEMVYYGTIDASNNYQQWYLIETVDYTNYYQFKYNDSGHGCGYEIYEGGRFIIAGVDDITDIKLQPNQKYYLKVSDNRSRECNYSISYTVKKDVADKMENAEYIEAGTTIKESICTANDEDWYKIKKVDYYNDYIFKFFPTLNGIYYSICDEYDNIIYGSYEGGEVNVNLEPGKDYYVKVSPGYGNDGTGEYSFFYKADETAPVVKTLEVGSDGVIRYYVNGRHDKTKTGIVDTDNFGMWYVENGEVNRKYNDLYYDETYGWYKISGGQIDFGYNDLYYSPTYGWWKVSGGQVDFGYNDLYYSPSQGWWKVSGGAVDFSYNDLYNSPSQGWWKVSGGQVDFGYNDLYYSPTCGWWKVSGGAVDFGYTDLYYSPTYGWWKVSGGVVDFGYTDLYCSPTYGWWKVSGGAVDFGYTDLYYSPTCGWWKVSGGAVDFGYNGAYNSPTCGWWNISGGSVVFN